MSAHPKSQLVVEHLFLASVRPSHHRNPRPKHCVESGSARDCCGLAWHQLDFRQNEAGNGGQQQN